MKVFEHLRITVLVNYDIQCSEYATLVCFGGLKGLTKIKQVDKLFISSKVLVFSTSGCYTMHPMKHRTTKNVRASFCVSIDSFIVCSNIITLISHDATLLDCT